MGLGLDFGHRTPGALIQSRGIVAVAVLLAIIGAVAGAGPIDGEWKAEFEGNRGPRTVLFKLKQDGGALLGSVDFGRREVEIEEGTIDGNQVSFSVSLPIQDREISMKYTGALREDALDLVLETRGRTREMTAHRVH